MRRAISRMCSERPHSSTSERPGVLLRFFGLRLWKGYEFATLGGCGVLEGRGSSAHSCLVRPLCRGGISALSPSRGLQPLLHARCLPGRMSAVGGGGRVWVLHRHRRRWRQCRDRDYLSSRGDSSPPRRWTSPRPCVSVVALSRRRWSHAARLPLTPETPGSGPYDPPAEAGKPAVVAIRRGVVDLSPPCSPMSSRELSWRTA